MGRILQEGRNCWRISKANRFALLVDGSNYYRAVAESITRAERSIGVVGWDVDSQIGLIRDESHKDVPDRFGDLLRDAASRNPDLEAFILDWDFPLIFAHERERLPTFGRDPFHHPRIHFQLDSTNPPGASHHQKIVVVDDSVGFAGGMDIARSRWDTPEHRANDERRTDYNGSYPPSHDVQVVVDGNAARSLAEIVHDRWECATGSRMPDSANGNVPWPEGVDPDIFDVNIAISRTDICSHDVEQLHLDLIQAARRFVYIENQYLTSKVIVEALRSRLSEPDGPEIVIVLPLKNFGWLEEHTIEVLRFQSVERLRRADDHNHLRICYPTVPDLGEQWISMHSKVLIVDDHLLRIGSSNLTNRSMGVDTECDLTIEASDAGAQRAILALRNRLLGEHLGLDLTAIERFLLRDPSLIRLVDSRSQEPRCLRKLEADKIAPYSIVDAEVVDPVKPLHPECLIEALAPQEARVRAHRHLWWLITVIVGMLGLAAVWQGTELSKSLNAEEFARLALANHQLAPLIVVLVFLAASLLVFPITPLIFVTAAVFGPWMGMVYSLLGGVTSGAATYGIGRAVGRNAVQKYAGPKLRRLMAGLRNRGVLSIVAIRMLPIAPFSIVNVILGAVRISFRDFTLGTLIGMAPGVVVISLFAYQIESLVREPGARNLVVLFAIGVAFVLLLRWLRRRVGSFQPRPVHFDHRDNRSVV